MAEEVAAATEAMTKGEVIKVRMLFKQRAFSIFTPSYRERQLVIKCVWLGPLSPSRASKRKGKEKAKRQRRARERAHACA